MFAESARHMAENSRRAGATPLKQPEDRKEYRMSLHKCKSPHWKGAYRERCKKRLRASREKFLMRFRHIEPAINEGGDPASQDSSVESPITNTIPSHAIASSVEEVMMEEWEHVRMEYGNLPPIPQSKRLKVATTTTLPVTVRPSNKVKDNFINEEFDTDVELVLSIMDELTEELIKEEQGLLAQYEESMRFNEEVLCAAVQGLSTDDVVCPICQKNFLHQNKQVIFCSCGVRLDMAHDGITLGYMRKQLDHYTLEHSSQCSSKPNFTLESVVHTQTIIMNCPTCCFMEIIV